MHRTAFSFGQTVNADDDDDGVSQRHSAISPIQRRQSLSASQIIAIYRGYEHLSRRAFCNFNFPVGLSPPRASVKGSKGGTRYFSTALSSELPLARRRRSSIAGGARIIPRNSRAFFRENGQLASRDIKLGEFNGRPGLPVADAEAATTARFSLILFQTPSRSDSATRQ